MRFAIAILACALAVANAQNGIYTQRQYSQFQQNNKQPYKPIKSISVTPARDLPVQRWNVISASSLPPVVTPIKVVADAHSAGTIKSAYDLNEDGSYNYYYETNNGIAAQAQGTPRNFGGNPPLIPDVVQGSFSWVSPEGKNIVVNYVADENGYQPQSDALPVPPELPAQIARALAYTAKYHSN